MNEIPPETNNTEFLLPIVCTHCGKENNLSMMFALLAPDAVKTPKEQTKNDLIEEDIY